MRCLILILLIMAGCTTKLPLPAESKICQNVFKGVTGVSQAISTTLQCDNLSAISGDISKEIMKLNICEDLQAQSALSDVVCPHISSVLSEYSTSKIPAHWGCSTELATELIYSKINSNCAKLIR